MQLKGMTKDSKFRLVCYSLFQLFNVISLIYFIIACAQGRVVLTQVLMCGVSIVFISVADIAQRLFKFKMATALYVFWLCYAICPMLGHSYGLYYHIRWWDKLLHLTAGVIFAMFGAYLPKLFMKKEDCSIFFCALVGIFFSVTVSVAWEFVEYFLDSVFNTDMQKDVWIGELNSYLINDLLGGKLGEILHTENVVTVINGQQVNGYVDVGKVDTIHDMLIEVIGAVVYATIYVIDKGKHTSFHFVSDEQKEIKVLEVTEEEKEVAQSADE